MQILNNQNDNAQTYSLKENIFYRFQEIFNEVRAKYQNIGSFILIVDQASLKVISSALKMADLIKMGVSSIEKLELKRKEHPNIHAIYYISPTKESVGLLISDFEGGALQIKNATEKKKKKEEKEKDKKKKKKKDKKKGEDDEDEEDNEDDEIIDENEEEKEKKKANLLQPLKKEDKNQPPPEAQYGRVHLFFTEKLPKHLLEDMAKSEKLVKRIRTMKEFNHNFFFFEQNGFQLNLESSLPILFSRKESQESKLLFECIADRLVTVLPALLRLDTINILYNNQDPNSLSYSFANYFEKTVQEAILKLKESDSPYIDPTSGEVYFIIIDRSIDPVTPLLHDYSYQSMIYDLLEVDTDKNIVEYEKTELKKDGKDSEPVKEVKKYKQQLSDNKDEVFAKFRYQNITHALKGIRDDFERHTEQMQRTKSASNKVRSIEDVTKIISEFPEYNELLQKYAVHFDLIMKCFNTFKKWNLQINCELEQSLVTGVDDVGKSIKSDKIFASIQDILGRKDIKRVDRLRIALIAFITLDLVREQREVIFNQFEGSEQKLLKNLGWLGIQFSDDSNAAFSRVNQKLVDLSKEKYNAYLSKQKNCFECKKIRGESKKLKKGEEESRQDCDACGQEYFVFSVMRHTPLSSIAIHSVIKQIVQPSYDQTQNQFSQFGFGCKQIGSSGRIKTLPKIEQPPPQENPIMSSSKKKQKSSSKKKDKEEQEIINEKGGLHKANEYEALLQKSENDDSEQLKKQKKVIVFFLGGVSYAEIRSIRQFQESSYENSPIIIGGTHLLTHRNYLEGLEHMTIFG